MNPVRTLFLFGTRPEAIKLAPLIYAMDKDPRFDPRVCVTAQHREMLDQVLTLFELTPHHDLSIMRTEQTLFQITSEGILALHTIFEKEHPDLVIVQGDTTTTLIGSLAAFYCHVPVAHVEAGLRTGKKYNPFPEEMNRRLTTHLADLHFAPTPKARDNLLREGIPPTTITVTGNTAIDALLLIKERIENDPDRSRALEGEFPFLNQMSRLLLVTAHRRESFGKGLENICRAIRQIADRHPDVGIVYPVHLNPNVQRSVRALLENVPNIFLLNPLEYDRFTFLMMRSYLILTDSGGIQEEAPSLDKPLLVMREVTERTEVIEAGVAKLVGTETRSIVENTEALLSDKTLYRRMTARANPYGDGTASQQIIKKLHQHLTST